jgi:hypothetical protein
MPLDTGIRRYHFVLFGHLDQSSSNATLPVFDIG